MTHTFLLTGATGYLGREVTRVLNERGIAWAPTGRAEGFELSKPAALAGQLESAAGAQSGPVTLLHLAAESGWAECERLPERAFAINAEATRVLAEAAHKLAARMLHVSTDLVFDGEGAPYGEQDEARPASVYGKSKRLGETAVLAEGGHLVVRIPLLYGASFDGTRGASDMVTRALGEDRQLDLFEDEWRTPLLVCHAASAIVELALDTGCHGIAHLPGPARLSRLELGLQIAREAGLNTSLIRATSRRDLAGPPRPKDCSLTSMRTLTSMETLLTC